MQGNILKTIADGDGNGEFNAPTSRLDGPNLMVV